MVGLSGVVGGRADDYTVRTVPPTIQGGEETGVYRGKDITVRSAFHTGSAVDQPVETAGGALVWVWGEVYSITDRGTGRTSVDPRTTARVCAEQYAEHGQEFVSRLDGEFVGCIYDETADTVSFFIDRLGVRPLYYATTQDGLAFSTNVQTVPDVAGFEPTFNVPYLAEYFYSRRTFGTKTPIEGIEQLAPATTLIYDAESGNIECHRYWKPEYRPVDKPLSYFTRELAERLKRSVADRTGDDREHGLLLSGGSDARAVLAAAESPPKSYHMGDGWNREARIAKRTADAAGTSFESLRRGPEYHAILLERAAPIMEFLGPFDTGHALGFAEKLRDEVDVLFTGLFGDTLFGEWSLPQPELPLPFGGRLSLPVANLHTNTADYVAAQVASRPTRQPSYLDAPLFKEILTENIYDQNGQVNHHGVSYDSFEQLTLSELYHPVTNGVGFDLYSSLQIMPIRNPFLDRRLIDLHLSMPLKYRLRREPVHRAMGLLDPSLAAISHATTRVPVKCPWAMHVAGEFGTDFLAKFDRTEPSYYSQGPWQDKNEIIRQQDFVGRAIERNESHIRRLSFLSWEAVREMYRSHIAGENHGQELYRLLTVLEMPLTRRITDPQLTITESLIQ